MNTVTYPLLTISYERDVIPVDTLNPVKVPDPGWRHVDRQGHGHFWDGGNLPTLEWVVTGTRWVGDEYDGVEIEVGEHRCKQCGETIQPGKKPEHGPRWVTGPATITVTINGEAFPLTEQQYADAVSHWQQHLRETHR